MRALTIGNFDGVHLGHQALVSRARALVGDGGEVVALSFDPHPAALLRPERLPPRLSTFEQREAVLRRAGADRVIRLVPTRELLAKPADEFLRELVSVHAPSHVVEGPDFHFGAGRDGNVQTLRRFGESHGFVTEVVSGVSVSLSDDLIAPASSSMVRWLLGHGRVRDAALVLGRAYAMDAVVVRGDRRGRELGFPTANLHTPLMLPADGVYGCWARLPDGRRYAAAVHVGPRATFDCTRRTVEAHLLGAGREPGAAERISGLPEYGWGITLEFVAWVREQIAFGSVEALVGQIRRDCERVRDALDVKCEPGAGGL